VTPAVVEPEPVASPPLPSRRPTPALLRENSPRPAADLLAQIDRLKAEVRQLERTQEE
jgi:hypothetical protein